MVFHVGRIVAKRAASPTVTILELCVPSLNSFSPGQWVDFVSPGKNWVGGFSLASAPQELPKLMLAVKASSQKPSQWVTYESKVGDSVKIRVGGDCVLVKDFDKPAVFCAGGIGVSPLLSMYRQHVQERPEGKDASFLYLVPNEDELVFVEEIVNLASINGDQVVASLTQQDDWISPLPGVECLTGRKVMSTFLQSKCSDRAIYYICGPPSMLDEAVDLLEEQGVSRTNVIYEKWW